MWKIHGENPRLPHWLIRENTVELGWRNDEDLTVRIDTWNSTERLGIRGFPVL